MNVSGGPGEDTEADVGAARSPSDAPRPQVSKKLVAIIVVVIIVSASVGVVWYFYFRHWSIAEVAGQVISDPDESRPGFKHSLAGKSVVIEGRVTDITNMSTNLGLLSFVELDDFPEMPLTYWGSVRFEIGDRIERTVSFEWSQCNDERHVYSPEIAFPTLVPMCSVAIVVNSVYHVHTSGGTTEIVNDGASIRTTITWLREPIPLDSINCTLRAGRGSYICDYLAAMGNYDANNVTDRMASLALKTGVNGTIEFVDSDDDHYLGNGDYFVFRNLTRPEQKSGLRTYMMTLKWPVEPWMEHGGYSSPEESWASIYYMVTSDGVLSTKYAQTPVVRVHGSCDGLERRCTFDHVDTALNWDDIMISMHDNRSSDWPYWYPAAANFSGTAPKTLSFPAQSVGYTDFILTCVDVAGDGCVQESDYLTIEVAGGSDLPEDVLYEFLVLYEGTHERMASPLLFASVIEPSSNLSFVEGNSPFTGEFSPVMFSTYSDTYLYDVSWDELRFILTDGTNESAIEPAADSLRGVSGSPVTLGTFALGSLSVLCNVTDLNGDGLVNRGDSVTLVALGPEGFLPSEVYQLSVVYTPESFVMSFAEFAG